jgi:putative acetyltransferase
LLTVNHNIGKESEVLTIKPVDPSQPEVYQLIEQLDQYQSFLYPPGSNHLDPIDVLSKSNVLFLAAYTDETVCGIGSVKLINNYGEIKRVFVPAEHRGKGVAMAIMEALEDHLIEREIPYARLETGIYQTEAIGLYERIGYHRIENFGEYKEDPLSIFMEKKLV